MILQSGTQQTIIAKAQSWFDEGYACSQSVLLAYTVRFVFDDCKAILISSSFGGRMVYELLEQNTQPYDGSFTITG